MVFWRPNKFHKIQYDSDTERASLAVECIRHTKNEETCVQAMAEAALVSWSGDGIKDVLVDSEKATMAVPSKTEVVVLDPSEDSRRNGKQRLA